jgi:N6-L-threonylcarbamoyladenine synthase
LIIGKNKDCNFSFSGFLAAHLRLINKLYEAEEKTERIVLNGTERKVLQKEIINDVCGLAQHIVSYQLNDRMKRALTYLLKYKGMEIKSVVVSGGVASNLYIRDQLNKTVKEFDLKASYPPVKYCTDNGVMIAWNGCEKLIRNSKEIVSKNQQNKDFFEQGIKPKAKCPFGVDISEEIKTFKIKIK